MFTCSSHTPLIVTLNSSIRADQTTRMMMMGCVCVCVCNGKLLSVISPHTHTVTVMFFLVISSVDHQALHESWLSTQLCLKAISSFSDPFYPIVVYLWCLLEHDVVSFVKHWFQTLLGSFVRCLLLCELLSMWSIPKQVPLVS